MSESKNSQWLVLVLDQLKSDITKLDDRQNEYIQDSASRGQLLHTLNDKVEKLMQIVSTGNGQPALTLQVADLKREVHGISQQQMKISETLDEIKTAVEAKATPAQKAERWKAVAVVAGGCFALIPGLLALFGVHM